MPQAGFLFSIAGLGVSLAGFSGLVIAFRRGGPLKPIDAFRLRLLPEMALGAAFLALLAIPLDDVIGDAKATIQIACGLGLLFTIGHAIQLQVRARAEGLTQPALYTATVVTINLLIVVAAVIGLVVGTAPVYEWVLLLMLARPGLTFVIVLSDVTPG